MSVASDAANRAGGLLAAITLRRCHPRRATDVGGPGQRRRRLGLAEDRDESRVVIGGQPRALAAVLAQGHAGSAQVPHPFAALAAGQAAA